MSLSNLNKSLHYWSSELQCIATLFICLFISGSKIDISSSPSSSSSPISPIAFVNITLFVVAFVLATKFNPTTANLPWSFIISFLSVVMHTFSPNCSLLYLPFCLLTPPLVLWITRSYLHCTISLFVQLINISLLFRIQIEEAIKIMVAQDLTERISQCLILGSFLLTFFFAYVFYTKDSRTDSQAVQSLLNSSESSFSPKRKPFNHEKLLPNFILHSKTLVQNITGVLDLILNHIEPGLGTKLIKIAQTSTEELNCAVHNLSELLKGDDQSQSIRSAPTCMRSFFQALWESAALSIQKRELNGVYHIDKSIPEEMEIDSNKVKMVVMNCFHSCLQMITKGSIDFTIEYAEPEPYEEGNFNDFETLEHFPYLATASQTQINEVTSMFGYFKTITIPSRPKKTLQVEKMLRIVVKSGTEKFSGKIEEVLSEIAVSEMTSSKLSEMMKLGLYVNQKTCESLGGEFKIYEKKGANVAFLITIPAVTLSARQCSSKRVW